MQVINRSTRWAGQVRLRLQELLRSGVAVATVAKEAGISHTSLVNFIDDRRDMGLGLFEKLATFLGMDLIIKSELPEMEVTRKQDKRVQRRVQEPPPPGGGG